MTETQRGLVGLLQKVASIAGQEFLKQGRIWWCRGPQTNFSTVLVASEIG